MKTNMIWKSILFSTLIYIYICDGTSSPIQLHGKYPHSIELLQNVAELWWTVNEINQEIIFELHMKTTGWIALGISPGILGF